MQIEVIQNHNVHEKLKPKIYRDTPIATLCNNRIDKGIQEEKNDIFVNSQINHFLCSTINDIVTALRFHKVVAENFKYKTSYIGSFTLLTNSLPLSCKTAFVAPYL